MKGRMNGFQGFQSFHLSFPEKNSCSLVKEKDLPQIIEANQGNINMFNNGLQVLILGSLVYFGPPVLFLYLIENGFKFPEGFL